MLVVTPIAGGLHPKCEVGDIMLICDRINLPAFSGQNPLKQPNAERFGVHFLATSTAYNQNTRQKVFRVWKQMEGRQSSRKHLSGVGQPQLYGSGTTSSAAEAGGRRCWHEEHRPDVLVAQLCGLPDSGFSRISFTVITDYQSTDKLQRSWNTASRLMISFPLWLAADNALEWPGASLMGVQVAATSYDPFAESLQEKKFSVLHLSHLSPADLSQTTHPFARLPSQSSFSTPSFRKSRSPSPATPGDTPVI
ncbi:Purine nucleoside phosphorylase [Fukomys damarensis]|uniref:purine-nucleoside phosphorylase n=1 Tax=Fukomys damarensis TaxID=885580 RepID=A0A091DD97_FUKDA|nr:Purine nucleoside phosphorylase [Fukomys damarensis]